jgi:hypothetical protein
MQYEFREFKVFDAPKINVPEQGKMTLTIACTSGIVGDSYGFEKVDNFNFVALQTDVVNDILAEIHLACVEYVATTYPNT